MKLWIERIWKKWCGMFDAYWVQKHENHEKGKTRTWYYWGE